MRKYSHRMPGASAAAKLLNRNCERLSAVCPPWGWPRQARDGARHARRDSDSQGELRQAAEEQLGANNFASEARFTSTRRRAAREEEAQYVAILLNAEVAAQGLGRCHMVCNCKQMQEKLQQCFTIRLESERMLVLTQASGPHCPAANQSPVGCGFLDAQSIPPSALVGVLVKPPTGRVMD